MSDVQKYMERNDASFVDQIPSLIGLAEQALAAELKSLLQLNVVETTLLAGQYILQKPARWRKTVSMSINGQPLLHRSQDYVRQLQYESDPGIPKYYSDYDYNHWAIAPIPDDNYVVQITYYSPIQPLDQDNQENLITREAPQALLFGTLLQAQGYLKSLDKIPVWKQYYDQSMQALVKENTSRNVDRNTSVQEP